MMNMSHQLPEAELVSRAQSGDSQALNALISSVRPGVLRFCRYRLTGYAGGLDAADDAAQETCAAIVHVLATYQDQGAPFNAMVYAIAGNKVADAQRRFSRAAICVDEFPEQTEPSPTPEEEAIAAAGFTAIKLLLGQLPDRMREVLVLRAAGASADAVGTKLGMSANAVRVAQHRAVARLRHLVDTSDEHRDFFENRSYHSARPAA